MARSEATAVVAPAIAKTPLDPRLIGLGVFAAALVLLFFRQLLDLATFGYTKQNYSHILVIPVVSAYMIWQKRTEISGPFRASFIPAILLFLAGVGLFIANRQLPGLPAADHFALVAASFLCFVWSGLLFFLGAKTLAPIAFPLVFLIFSIPLPTVALDGIEIALQHASAESSYWLLSASGVPLFRDGLSFRLPGVAIRVAQECSGFNSTYMLFIVSLFGGQLFLKSPWRRAFLTFIVIPLAIVRNGLRIMTIALLCVYVDPGMINSWVHSQGGPLFFAISLVPFIACLWYLRRAESRTQPSPALEPSR